MGCTSSITMQAGRVAAAAGLVVFFVMVSILWPVGRWFAVLGSSGMLRRLPNMAGDVLGNPPS